jgi:hypothetical protein
VICQGLLEAALVVELHGELVHQIWEVLEDLLIKRGGLRRHARSPEGLAGKGGEHWIGGEQHQAPTVSKEVRSV